MSDSALSPPTAAPAMVEARRNPSPIQLVRMPVERSHAAVEFLLARSEGVMDLIAHFWERLSQTPPLSRGDLHLLVALPLDAGDQLIINISTLNNLLFTGAMLYVPKAHRADVLALDAKTAGAFAAYIGHHGPKAVRSDNVLSRVEISEPVPTVTDSDAVPVGTEIPGPGSMSVGDPSPANATTNPPPVVQLTDLSGSSKGSSTSSEFLLEVPTVKNGGGNGKIPIDFLTGHADGIGWMTPLLLPAVNRKSPARQMVNVVMQLPAAVTCENDASVRVAREADLPVLNRWRRQYKEERGILFDADLDAWVQTQRVFVYEHEKQVVAVAKFDLELPRVIEIGGVYTFPEFRTRGFGARIVSDLACRIRQAGKTPTLQVDEQNAQAVRLYEGLGWKAQGKLARVWLTG